ncbi:MAG: HAMP domain-containing histidine kinase [Chitinophagaceae bacterium]|nr:MAG: HAMP domain-containing histidine kinase [Chitinophagaceae bacterium]
MTKLLNRTMRQFIIYASIVLLISVPVYYVIISNLWNFELQEHGIRLTDNEGREDSFIIISAVTGVTVVFFVLMFAGFLLINRKISGKLWLPFRNSLDTIRDFNLDQQTVINFEKSDIDEFNELNTSLAKLISGNVAAYRQQKEFADNASHELQTPLAIIQSKLELLSQTHTLNADQYKIIDDTLKALSKVSRINKNLLLLTKIENNQYAEDETLDLAALIESHLALFDNFFEERQLIVEQSLLPGKEVRGNKILLEILLNNLITNAIRYTEAGNLVKIDLSDAALIISNSGSRSLNETAVFKRFSTGTNKSPGTGLGLALVKEICTRHQWTASYAFEEGWHKFAIRFADNV